MFWLNGTKQVLPTGFCLLKIYRKENLSEYFAQSSIKCISIVMVMNFRFLERNYVLYVKLCEHITTRSIHYVWRYRVRRHTECVPIHIVIYGNTYNSMLRTLIFVIKPEIKPNFFYTVHTNPNRAEHKIFYSKPNRTELPAQIFYRTRTENKKKFEFKLYLI